MTEASPWVRISYGLDRIALLSNVMDSLVGGFVQLAPDGTRSEVVGHMVVIRK